MTFQKNITALALLALAAAFAPAQAAVFVQGNATVNIKTALNTIGISYTDLGTGAMSNTPAAGDTLIMSFDGGTAAYVDYRTKLAQGMDIILFGGSNYQPYRDWASLYFNLTDTANGWHLGGAWTSIGSNAANQFMPANYTPTNSSVSYHMLGFAATQDTTLLGRNAENVAIAAFREYANGGSFNYLAMDPGPYANNTRDQAEFTVPYLRGALAAAASGLNTNRVPEPTSLLLVGAALAALGLRKRQA